MEVMPPKPVPCVDATSAGCRFASNSPGVKPEATNASTAVSRFQMAMRSIDSVMDAGIPQCDGSKSVGNCPPTVRESVVRRGT